MRLKTYQQDTLDILQRFFEDCRIMGAQEAYAKITSEPEIALRLGKLRCDYVRWDAISNTPRVCLKVPTGGGKTIIAAHAVKVAANTWCEKDYPVVLWFCPSDTIRRQSAEALKNTRHPYRMALDEQFGGGVRIFDIDEKFNIRPADIENNVCVIVSTIQAFRQSDTNKYNVYRHNEFLEPHFTRITVTAGMETDDSGNVKFSFANLLFHHRPIVIVDEAHNVISNLSRETQRRINPSAIVELTATPQFNNNTLYNVRAAELKEEEMIKLPIELREHLGWEQAVDEAVIKRAELEKAAGNEMEYIRPILLFQAQDKNGEVNVETLKNYLLNTSNMPANEIAIVTGEQKELDGIDIFSRDCPIKYIITVEALKEGWDCSFAYVLCSLANVQSNTAVEQLLGRVMRMPYARARKTGALNKAYAYVLSKRFGEAAETLVRKLINKGFDDTEAAAVIEPMPVDNGLFGRHENYKVDLEEPILVAEISSTFQTENNGKTIVFTQETTEDDIQKLITLVSPAKAAEIRYKFDNYKRMDLVLSPAKLGEKFSVPKLFVELQGEFIFAEPDDIFQAFDWNIIDFVNAKMDAYEFNIEPHGNGFVINLDGNKLIFSSSNEQVTMSLELEHWTVANLVSWLDCNLRQDDIPQPQMVEWLRRVVQYLTEVRGLELPALMVAKYALKNKIIARIETARKEVKRQAFQTALFARDSRVMLNFDNGFNFFNNMYDDELCEHGSYRFKKHFLNRVPQMGKEEEPDCAKAIDDLLQVKFWLRNVARHPNSFWLPTSTDRFYPDFAVMLNDGRILIVEYKGEHIKSTDDTKEKQLIGELWEKNSGGRALFMIAEKSHNGLNVSEQIKKKIDGL